MDLGNLSEEARDALSELVHEQADELASNAINNGQSIEWLIANGWMHQDITTRLSAMVIDDSGDDAASSPADSMIDPAVDQTQVHASVQR
jgi:hypothetical protein